MFSLFELTNRLAMMTTLLKARINHNKIKPKPKPHLLRTEILDDLKIMKK